MRRAQGRRPLQRRGEHSATLVMGPNMTPMVDVVIVILIFFMSATTFMGPEWFMDVAVPAQSPSTGEQADPFAMPAPTLRVHLEASGGSTIATGLGRQDMTLEELESALAAVGASIESDDAFVLIVPKPNVAYRDVIRVRDLCERAGLQEVALSTR